MTVAERIADLITHAASLPKDGVAVKPFRDALFLLQKEYEAELEALSARLREAEANAKDSVRADEHERMKEALADEKKQIAALEKQLSELESQKKESERELPEAQFEILKVLPSEHGGDWPTVPEIANRARIRVDIVEIHLPRLEKRKFARLSSVSIPAPHGTAPSLEANTFWPMRWQTRKIARVLKTMP
jgi:hypothetical protein